MKNVLDDADADVLALIPAAELQASGLCRSADKQLLLDGHRISLQDVVALYDEGQSVEQIVAHFPTLGLSQVHRVVAFYLDHRDAVTDCVERERATTLEFRRRGHTGPGIAELRQRLACAKAE